MKTLLNYTIALVIAIVLIQGCKKSTDFLDNRASTALNEDLVFSDSIRTMQFLGRIYQDIGFWFNPARFSGAGNTDVVTDDQETLSGNTAAPQVLLVTGAYNALTGGGGLMGDCYNVAYANIRRVNLLLSKLPNTPLAESTKQRIAGEARFLRAWFYYQLMISFGGVPLIGDKVFGISDLINLPRNTWEECVNYVVSESNACAQILPSVTGYADPDYGRATKGAALALKSKMLLTAASPLFNGGSMEADAAVKPLIGYPSASPARWQAAADAANEVINSGQYTLYIDKTTRPAEPGYGFVGVFLTRNQLPTPEYIFAFYRGNNKDMEAYFTTQSRGGSSNSTRATQSVVDAFPTINGKPITEDIKSPANPTGYDAANPYANRDPRFGYSIIHNGALYYSTSTSNRAPVDTYQGAPGQDGFPGNLTGYFIRKMCDDNISANSSFTTQRAWPLIRYAEILLNYAEAINETGQTSQAYAPLIKLRERAGILPGADNSYGLKAGMTQDEMRTVIRNERRIELFAEGIRYDDIRRWKIATMLDGKYGQGMKITKTGSTFTYEVITTNVNRHGFKERNYLWPIPDGEVRKMPAMLQNPGY